MTLEDVRGLSLFQTRAVSEAVKDEQTGLYVVECLNRFFTGDYGEIPQEDTDANNADLKAGSGRIVAHYKKAQQLRDDLCIICEFNGDPDDLQSNYTTVLYRSEY